MLNYDGAKALVGACELSHDIGGEPEQGDEDEDNPPLKCGSSPHPFAESPQGDLDTWV